MSVPNLLGIYFLAKVLRLEILRHKHQAASGTLEEIPEDLQVGLRDHQPTEEQVASEKKRRAGVREKRKRIRAGFRKAQKDRGVDVTDDRV